MGRSSNSKIPKVGNALLRIEGVKGRPPDGFEKPSATNDFWVLELSGQREEPLEIWTIRVVAILKARKDLLTELKKKGCQSFLFVETSRSLLPVTFSAGLIKILADCGAVLEHSTG